MVMGSPGRLNLAEAAAATPTRAVSQKTGHSPAPSSFTRGLGIGGGLPTGGIGNAATMLSPERLSVEMLRRENEEQQRVIQRMLLQRQQEGALLAAAAMQPGNLHGGSLYPSLGGDTNPQMQALLQQRQQMGTGLLPAGGGLSATSNMLLGGTQRTIDLPGSSLYDALSNQKSASATNKAYYDASKDPDPSGPDQEEEEDEIDKLFKRKKSKRDTAEAFPAKLYRMIEEAENNNEDDIISFFSHGRAFAIHKPQKFVNECMPKYFSTKRLSSFQRQLNLYGFKRITEGRDKGGYFHEYFLKEKKELVKKIKRKKPSPPKGAAEELDGSYGGGFGVGIPASYFSVMQSRQQDLLAQSLLMNTLQQQEQPLPSGNTMNMLGASSAAMRSQMLGANDYAGEPNRSFLDGQGQSELLKMTLEQQRRESFGLKKGIKDPPPRL